MPAPAHRRAAPRSSWPLVLGAVLVLVVIVAVAWFSGIGRGDTEPGPRTKITRAETVGDFALQTGAEFRQAEDDLVARLREQSAAADPVVGYYQAGEDRLAFVGLVFDADSDEGEDLAASPEAALRDYLDSADVLDVEASGSGDSLVLCGAIEPAGEPAQRMCAWSDRSSLGTVRFVSGALVEAPLAEAAEVTRDFRAATTDG